MVSVPGYGACAEPAITACAAAGDTGYSDVAADEWYAEAVTWCRENKIMNGTSDTTFDPDGTLTRAMLATVLHRAEGTPATDENGNVT